MPRGNWIRKSKQTSQTPIETYRGIVGVCCRASFEREKRAKLGADDVLVSPVQDV